MAMRRGMTCLLPTSVFLTQARWRGSKPKHTRCEERRTAPSPNNNNNSNNNNSNNKNSINDDNTNSSNNSSPSPSYYGSYSGDRFGGGIGRRVGVDESRRQALPGTGVARVALFSDSHERLRDWASSSERWREATRIHKAAYFTRTENLAQEAVVERVRQHYCDASAAGYVARAPVQAALFRLEDEAVLQLLCDERKIQRLPAVVLGVFDERAERCVVDFANKRLGGGWLSYGMVQEEIMFLSRFDYGALCARSLLEMEDPTAEPLASPFSMHENEAWILRGGVSFAEIGWYGRTPADAMSRLKLLDPSADRDTAPTIVAIDAIKAGFEVYKKEHLWMMLIKAYTGFVAARADPDVGSSERIATGSWGCGAFYNNERVMFVVQTLAASLAGVELTHHILGDGRSLAAAFEFLEAAMLSRRSISQVLDDLAELCASDPAWKTKYRPPKPAAL
ncbi:unnamed protein product [Polarella glacialis]|uniref:PARG catalytic Macro domain-containing protein n=1 Tax=Polarella glacialis TaxID=89957 RepID=A0A813FWP8_POLGL|nr:unnamed protein product [Polarella glacialis]